MKRIFVAGLILVASAWTVAAQDNPAAEEGRYNTRYSVALIDDATFYANVSAPIPMTLNQVLLEPTFSVKYLSRWTFSTSVVGTETTYRDNVAHIRVKETYAGLSAGDFDFMTGRKMLRWGAGYAFTSAGVLDPPRVPTDPGDRLNLNEGRDMVKVDWVRGPHAISAAWSTAELARQGNDGARYHSHPVQRTGAWIRHFADRRQRSRRRFVRRGYFHACRRAGVGIARRSDVARA